MHSLTHQNWRMAIWKSYNSWFGAPGAPGAPGSPRVPGAPEEPQRVSCRWIANVIWVAEGKEIHISDFVFVLKCLLWCEHNDLVLSRNILGYDEVFNFR